MTNSAYLFTFNVPKNLKDDVIDHLMATDLVTGFNLRTVMGYSHEHSAFSLDEQVRGYKDMVQFEVLVSEAKFNGLKQSLANVLSTVKVRYWLMPIIETGHL